MIASSMVVSSTKTIVGSYCVLHYRMPSSPPSIGITITDVTTKRCDGSLQLPQRRRPWSGAISDGGVSLRSNCSLAWLNCLFPFEEGTMKFLKDKQRPRLTVVGGWGDDDDRGF
ncbi:hypothetical protein SESBI_32806 [Sesbania bispinosa]|nr:hypothetical protein SESBI_32806 [Sesbania bispinosa]